MIESPFYNMILEEGIEEGIKREKLEIARKMLSRGIELSAITDLTGLSEEVLRERGLLG